MLTRHTLRDITWVDLESPTNDEIADITKEFDLHPAVAAELISPSERQKVEPRDESMYLVMHFPVMDQQHSTGELVEIDFVLGKKYLITVHYESINALYEFGKMMEVNSLLDKSPIGPHAGYLFYLMVQFCYETLEKQVEFIVADLRNAERQVFRGREKQMVSVLSQINRRILDQRIALRSHEELWKSFEAGGRDMFGAKFGFYLTSISSSYMKLANKLHNNHEILTELRMTNDSLLTTKTNETMVHLTMMAFVTFPLTLIAGIFSMGTEHTPIRGMQNDFWIIIGLMAALTAILFGVFKYRKWL